MVNSVGPRDAFMAKVEPTEEPAVTEDADEKNEGKKEKKPRAANPWLVHVAAFKRAHPDLKYKDVLKQAKETYVKVVRAAPG